MLVEPLIGYRRRVANLQNQKGDAKIKLELSNSRQLRLGVNTKVKKLTQVAIVRTLAADTRDLDNGDEG